MRFLDFLSRDSIAHETITDSIDQEAKAEAKPKTTKKKEPAATK
jgi:hypothetical protein